MEHGNGRFMYFGVSYFVSADLKHKKVHIRSKKYSDKVREIDPNLSQTTKKTSFNKQTLNSQRPPVWDLLTKADLWAIPMPALIASIRFELS